MNPKFAHSQPSHFRGHGKDIARDSSLYRLPPDASNGQWNLLRVSKEFDSAAGDFTEILIDRMNLWASNEPSFSPFRLKKGKIEQVPQKILLLDGSPSRLPLSTETARIASDYFARRGLSIPVYVVNRRDELLARISQNPRETMVLSQSAQRSLYDAALAEALVGMGVIIVPGPLTAADGPLSNKEKTYQLLTNDGNEEIRAGATSRRLAARYHAIHDFQGNAPGIASAILDTISELKEKWGQTRYFIKPLQGGGGRGCFRIDIFPKGYALPDLTRLGIAQTKSNPIPLTLDPDNGDHIRALVWLANRFRASSATSKAYLRTGRSFESKDINRIFSYISKTMKTSPPILSQRLRRSAESRIQAHQKLTAAINNYQMLYGVPYRALICEWIDFGIFGLRAHLRLGDSGPILESLYARLFPIEFADETIGTIGVDSITNRNDGGMEFNRYSPLLPLLVSTVGGPDSLSERIQNAFFAFARFVSLLPPHERERLPVRAEFDISPMNGLIPEGNADPVRAQSANSRWERFVRNGQEWIDDALSYYSWKTRSN